MVRSIAPLEILTHFGMIVTLYVCGFSWCSWGTHDIHDHLVGFQKQRNPLLALDEKMTRENAIAEWCYMDRIKTIMVNKYALTGLRFIV